MNLLKVIICSAFAAYLVHQEFNISSRIKHALRWLFIKRGGNPQSEKWTQSEYVKALDCFPCVSWWFSVSGTAIAFFIFGVSILDIWLAPPAVFLFGVLIDRK